MDDDWNIKRVDAALQTCPVADGIASAIKDQLKGTMRERSLRPAELSAFAKSLLEAINNSPANELAQ